jgi:hypothetical protein
MEQRKNTGRRTLASRITRVRLVQRKSIGIMAVYEADPAETGPDARALVFEWGGLKTRTTEFPEQWQQLSDDELAAIRRGTLE